MGIGQHDVLRVSTSDNVGIGYDIAGLGSRFIAQLLDSLIVGVIAFIVNVGVLAAINPSDAQDSLLAGLAAAGITLFVYVGYFTLCEVSTGGRTPGKSSGHLRVLDISGAAPTSGQLLLRNVARIIDVLAGVGVVVMFWNRQSRRIGDLLAGTVVVRVRPTLSFAAVVAPPPVLLRTPDAGPAIDGVDHLGERELSAIRTFLTRPGLEPPLRARLALDMTTRLLDRMQVPPAAPERLWPPELFLERLYLQLQARVTVDAFIATRRERWAELEAMLQRSRRGRLRDTPAADLERFGALNREAASDLAIARRDFPDNDVATYLNDLCARAHPMMYRSPPLRPRDLVRWFAVGIPRAYRARRVYVLLSLGLLLAGAVAGWLAVDLRPDLRASLIPASGFDQLARGQVNALPNAPLLGTVIITNNIKVAAVCFLGGALAGLPTAFILAANGWMLGTIAAAVHQGGYDLAFWSLIVPHGVLELSIIVIAGAAGLSIGDAILRPGLLRRGEAFTRAALGSLGLVAGMASLLIISGILEAYVSPSVLPAWLKLLIGAAVGVALYSWLLLTGRSRHERVRVQLDRAAAA